MPLWTMEGKKNNVRTTKDIQTAELQGKIRLRKIAGERYPERESLTRGTLTRLK